VVVVGACQESVAVPLEAGAPLPVDEVEEAAAAEPLKAESPSLQPASSDATNARTSISFSDFKAHPHTGARPSRRTHKFVPVKRPPTAQRKTEARQTSCAVQGLCRLPGCFAFQWLSGGVRVASGSSASGASRANDAQSSGGRSRTCKLMIYKK
jgi:hypothetical protein